MNRILSYSNYKIFIAIAILIIIILVMGSLIFYRLDNPKVEIRYIDRVITNEKVVTVKEYVGQDIKWEVFEITAYTQQDEGCDNVTSIGLDLEDTWTQYFNLVAVDPTVIPYGTTVFIKDGKEIISALAVDTGGAITGNRLDLYVKTLDEAYRFGRRSLLVGVIK